MYRIYRNNVIEALKYLSDYEFQRIAWFSNDQNLIASYNENVMWVFDDTTLSDALKSGKVVFSNAADAALRDLEKATDKIDGLDYSEEELIDMPEMQIIREKAAYALRLINETDGRESTVEMIG